MTRGKTNKAKPWTQARDARHEKQLADSKALIHKQPSAIGGSGLFCHPGDQEGAAHLPAGRDSKTHAEVQAAPRDHWWHEYALGSSAAGWSVIPDLDSVGWHLANHSCNPNAIIDAKRDNYLVARRDIAPDQEITFDYGWERFEPMPCRCGEEHCSGNIGLHHPEGDLDVLNVARTMRTAYIYRNNVPFKRFFHAFRGQLDTAKLDALFELAFGSDKDAAVERMFREGIHEATYPIEGKSPSSSGRAAGARRRYGGADHLPHPQVDTRDDARFGRTVGEHQHVPVDRTPRRAGRPSRGEACARPRGVRSAGDRRGSRCDTARTRRARPSRGLGPSARPTPRRPLRTRPMRRSRRTIVPACRRRRLRDHVARQTTTRSPSGHAPSRGRSEEQSDPRRRSEVQAEPWPAARRAGPRGTGAATDAVACGDVQPNRVTAPRGATRKTAQAAARVTSQKLACHPVTRLMAQRLLRGPTWVLARSPSPLPSRRSPHDPACRGRGRSPRLHRDHRGSGGHQPPSGGGDHRAMRLVRESPGLRRTDRARKVPVGHRCERRLLPAHFARFAGFGLVGVAAAPHDGAGDAQGDRVVDGLTVC